jgi:F0F1-type ATP synthase delta subunit
LSFPAERWAEAFIAAAADDYTAGFELLRALAAVPIHRRLSGLTNAKALTKRLNEVCAKNEIKKTQGINAACAVIALLIARGQLKYFAEFVRAAEKMIEQRLKIIEVFLEAAAEPEPDFLDSLKEAIKTKRNARDVRFLISIKPELIGGYRFTIGSERWDTSLRGMLAELKTYIGGSR